MSQTQNQHKTGFRKPGPMYNLTPLEFAHLCVALHPKLAKEDPESCLEQSWEFLLRAGDFLSDHAQ